MSDSYSPLARLVLVMVCLSIAGALGAGAHYYAIDLPEQKTLQVPQNSVTNSLITKCTTCIANCNYVPDNEKYECLGNCELIC